MVQRREIRGVEKRTNGCGKEKKGMWRREIGATVNKLSLTANVGKGW